MESEYFAVEVQTHILLEPPPNAMINLTFPQVIFVPPVLIILGAVTLLNFKNLFLAITNCTFFFMKALIAHREMLVDANNRTSNELVKTIKPALVYVKNFLEAVVGKASSFSFKLEHILLVAIVFALFAVANEISIGNDLKEKELKLLRAQAKASDKKDAESKKKD
ncbi:hypothetical protein DYB32_007319 [Aphanomyces invadans]|uniref:Uncharacterized protein n=1 Tax=Aphanomyces invadans TaxID=157072 RepID=A0A3R6VI84_9STRA|nr:hypothetical protein DYB32_007319 [Aphanomyces invadans]